MRKVNSLHNQKVRQCTFAEALREAFVLALQKYPQVFLIGEGIPDKGGAFGTTQGLQERFGKDRVMDMPLSENGITGVCIGAALAGMHPILSHMRVDFALLSMDQIINNAAMWHFMYGGKTSVPIIIRAIVGRGWGQGPQHSQNLHALFSHIPGLKVIMPARPYDAKGLMLSAIVDKNPVIFIEHRWLHETIGPVPETFYTVPIGKAQRLNSGNDITIIASSYMTLVSARAAELISRAGYSVDLIDLRTTKPLDREMIISSVKKTGRVLVVDSSWRTLGLASEIIASIAERVSSLRSLPKRLTLPDSPAPTSFALAKDYYPSVESIANATLEMLDVGSVKKKNIIALYKKTHTLPDDVPNLSFQGPF